MASMVSYDFYGARAEKEGESLRSYPGRTRWGRAACGAAALSGPARSTWPAPRGSARATAREHEGDARTLLYMKENLPKSKC